MITCLRYQDLEHRHRRLRNLWLARWHGTPRALAYGRDQQRQRARSPSLGWYGHRRHDILSRNPLDRSHSKPRWEHLNSRHLDPVVVTPISPLLLNLRFPLGQVLLRACSLIAPDTPSQRLAPLNQGGERITTDTQLPLCPERRHGMGPPRSTRTEWSSGTPVALHYRQWHPRNPCRKLSGAGRTQRRTLTGRPYPSAGPKEAAAKEFRPYQVSHPICMRPMRGTTVRFPGVRQEAPGTTCRSELIPRVQVSKTKGCCNKGWVARCPSSLPSLYIPDRIPLDPPE